MAPGLIASAATLIVPLLVAAAALAAVVFLLWVARGQSAAVEDLEELPGKTQPVDLAAFRNLTDPAEEDYLRTQLPAREFRRLQRERLRASLEYVGRAARNAALLVRLGEAARRHPDPAVAQAARELVDDALRLRLYALLAGAKLRARLLLPGARLSPASLLERYQRLTETVGRLSRAQNPSFAGRITAAL
jgi:hypothetical protein